MESINLQLVEQNLSLGNFSREEPSHFEGLWKVVSGTFWTLSMVFNPAVDFFSQALSDAVGLETYRHGTSYSAYLGIRHKGLDPNFGGKGASKSVQREHYIKTSKNKVHFGSDSKTYENTDSLGNSKVKQVIMKLFAHFFVRNAQARLYCFFTAKGGLFLTNPVRFIQVGIQTFFVPTVKVRMLPSERDLLMEKANNMKSNLCFEVDPDSNIYGGLCAYRTNLAIGTSYIGLRGIFQQGVKGNVFKRIKAHPVKASWGMVKLVNPIGIIVIAAFAFAYAGHMLSTCSRGD